MPKEGLEPTRANAHYALNVARLPIPPLRLTDEGKCTMSVRFCQTQGVLSLVWGWLTYQRAALRKRSHGQFIWLIATSFTASLTPKLYTL